MLTRVLFALAILCGAAPAAAAADEVKVLKLGLADHAVTAEELDQGAPATPRFNSAGIAYALVANVRMGDIVTVTLKNEGKPLMSNTATLAEDNAAQLLLAGKRGVPAGGWPEGSYQAEIAVTRDGKDVIRESSPPIPFP